jgi:hypothetical protein
MLPCPHGRPSWHVCPHCNGINEAARNLPAGTVTLTCAECEKLRADLARANRMIEVIRAWRTGKLTGQDVSDALDAYDTLTKVMP